MKSKKWLAAAAFVAVTLALAGCSVNPGTNVPQQITLYTEDAADRVSFRSVRRAPSR